MTQFPTHTLLTLAYAILMTAPAFAAPQAGPAKDISDMDQPITASESINASYEALLKKYVVKDGDLTLVRYGDVTSEDKAKLDDYIAALSKSGPPSSTDESIMAYWFNLYNAKTVSVILDNYPVESIRDIGGGLFSSGPWKDKSLIVAGKKMSLDNIEHDTVRAKYDEPLVHYAFNCASIGCPNLKTSPWTAETLKKDLVEAASAYINSSRGISVDDRGRIKASEIFKWYKEDFGGSDSGILAHAALYASPEKKAALTAASKIHSFDYDWSLNTTK